MTDGIEKRETFVPTRKLQELLEDEEKLKRFLELNPMTTEELTRFAEMLQNISDTSNNRSVE